MSFTITGKCSEFGGPNDTGVGVNEDLSLYGRKDLSMAPEGMFLPDQPPGTGGTARRLNPEFFYCAMRWAYMDDHKSKLLPGLGFCLPVTTTPPFLHGSPIFVKNPKFPQITSARVWAADWGPNSETGRIIDCSPGLLRYLGASTDDELTVEIPD